MKNIVAITVAALSLIVTAQAAEPRRTPDGPPKLQTASLQAAAGLQPSAGLGASGGREFYTPMSEAQWRARFPKTPGGQPRK